MLGGGRGGVEGLGLSAGGTTLWPILALGLTAQGGGGLEPPKTRFSCTRLDGGGAALVFHRQSECHTPAEFAPSSPD